MEMLSSKQKIAIIIAGVFVVGIFMFYMLTRTNDYDYSTTNTSIEEVKTEEKEEIKEEVKKEIIIHITGAVKNEGIVKIIEGERIADAIDKAGGLTNEADLTNVNLAYVLKDGQKIYIPKIIDTEETETVIDENGKGVIVDSGVSQEKNISSKININTASMNELSSLTGIGEGIALKIIEYREANGAFKSVEDIKNVSGIGDSKYESIKDYICVE